VQHANGQDESMSELTYQLSTNSDLPEREVIAERDASTYTPGRCVIYAIFSDLLASPFDAEPAVAGEALVIAELQLPYELTGFQELLYEWRMLRTEDSQVLNREYSGLFEVGSDGPPVPIREDLHLNQPAGVREDLVRFYDFFGYGLEEQFAWSPDHLSIELEFMHFLCFKEAQLLEAKESGEEVDATSYQLAQSDFSERHLCNWISELAEKTATQSDGIYPRLLAALTQFVIKDFEWQADTINSRQEL
jgi:DMSO reductase family type II enzyme chaperone